MSELIGNLATSRNAMMAQLHALSAVSNNIANANTVGYKTEEVSFHTLISQPVGQYGAKGVEGSTATAVNRTMFHGMRAQTVTRAGQQGTLRPTERQLDIAVRGRGFFPVQSNLTQYGETLFSRSGSFSKDIIYDHDRPYLDPNSTNLPSIPENQNHSSGEIHLKDAGGNYLMAIPVDENGEAIGDPTESSLTVVAARFDHAGDLAPAATTKIRIQALVPSDGGRTRTEEDPDNPGQTVFGDEYGSSTTLYNPRGDTDEVIINWRREADAANKAPVFSVLVKQPVPNVGNVSTTLSSIEGTNTATLTRPNGTQTTVSTDKSNAAYYEVSTSGQVYYVQKQGASLEPSTESGEQHDEPFNEKIGNKLVSNFDLTLLDFESGDTPYNVTFDIEGSSGYAIDYSAYIPEKDGHSAGTLIDLSFDGEGYIRGEYNNGFEQRLYRLPLAYFRNNEGLNPKQSTAFEDNTLSGEANFYYPGSRSGGAGDTAPGVLVVKALETSATDIVFEFQKLIETQRAYQSTSRAFTIADELNKEAMNLKQ